MGGYPSCLPPAGSVLDYGCGSKAKLLQAIQTHSAPGTVLVGADPCITHGAEPHGKQQELGQRQAAGALLLTGDCGLASVGAGVVSGGYDVVVCSLVLCTLTDREEYLSVLDDLAAAVKPGAWTLRPCRQQPASIH